MALRFHPGPGAILLCDYATGFKVPEMVKIRPVIVISPRFRGRAGLSTVVPLSTTPPRPVMPYHCEVEPTPRGPAPYDAPTSWVKADMLATVGHARLKPMHRRVGPGTARKTVYPAITAEELAKVRECVCHALGIDP